MAHAIVIKLRALNAARHTHTLVYAIRAPPVEPTDRVQQQQKQHQPKEKTNNQIHKESLARYNITISNYVLAFLRIPFI